MSQIEHISDTARWVAVYRAMETSRADAIFRDPYAERLAGEKGHAIVEAMPHGRRYAWPMIVRTAVFDDIILDRIRNGGIDTVLNLAAGLDARPWRMPLPPTLRWVDVDLPGILDYKVGMLAQERTVCRYEAVRLDLADDARRKALFAQVGREARRVLVVSEGLLVYLDSEQVAGLATDLHAQPNFQWWLHDLASPRLLKMMSKTWGRSVAAGNAPFKFAPAESTKFFEPYGWREAAYRPTFEEGIRLKRTMPFARLWQLLGFFARKKRREEFKRFSGNVLLERV
ncbi:MAG TPA: class I SAM-dependent methyltransferase [Gemmatimonadaceae bacterium]|nr:class I SAM-dependent methyltransferase [Gemmatimonadaceae bacterium]